jgi:hypothetical protein
MISGIPAPLAWPGDDDLDVDLDNLTVLLVDADFVDQQLTVVLSGGFGTLVASGGHRLTIEPGDPHLRIRELGLRIPAATDPTAVFGERVARFERWRQTSTPLRLVAAPGRQTVLMEDLTGWTAIPRHCHVEQHLH